MTYRIELPWPDSVISENNTAPRWIKTAAKKKYRRTAWILGLEAKLPKCEEPILQFTFHPPNRRWDCQNIPQMMKSAIDGFADAMKVDDKKFRCRYPDQFAEVRKGGQVVVEIDTPSVLVERRGTINGDENAGD